MSITTTPEVEFEDVVFATLPSERFRARICARNNGTLIWLECKRSKKQWQAIIDKIGQCGSHNLPEDFVVESLQTALRLARTNDLESDELKIILARSESDMIMTLTLSPMGTWTPKFTFTLNALTVDRLDRLEAVLRDNQEESQALRAELHTLRQLVERNADRIGDIKQIHGDPALLAVHGWAFCDGTTPAEQGIEGALRNGPTPDLTGGVFVKGGPVANLGLTTKATTLVISSECRAIGSYTHDPVAIPTDGSVATKGGLLPFGGKWDGSPPGGTGLKLHYDQPELQPKSYSVVYVIKVK